MQIQPSDALEPEFPKKYRSLLRCWREKVFVLMVQLKAQDLEHRNSMKGLTDQVRALFLIILHSASHTMMTVLLWVVTMCWAQALKRCLRVPQELQF